MGSGLHAHRKIFKGIPRPALAGTQNSRPMEKFTRLCPVGLALAANAIGPTMVSAMIPRLNVPRTTTGPGSAVTVPKAVPASYHPPQ